MPPKPFKYLSVAPGRRMTELDLLRYTDACVHDATRLLKERAAAAAPAFASELMARTER